MLRFDDQGQVVEHRDCDYYIELRQHRHCKIAEPAERRYLVKVRLQSDGSVCATLGGP